MIGGVEVHSYNPPQVLLVNVPKRHGPWVGSFRPDKNSHWCTVGPAGLPLGVATFERGGFTGSILISAPQFTFSRSFPVLTPNVTSLPGAREKKEK